MSPRKSTDAEELVTTEQAAEILSRNHGRLIPASRVRDLASKGKLTKVPLDGRTSRYLRKEVEALRIHDKPGRPQRDKQ